MVRFLVSIVPSAGALFLFWLALRAIFQADRRERAAIARYEAEHPVVEPGQGSAEPAADDDLDAADDSDAGDPEADDPADDPADDASADEDAVEADGARMPRAGT